MCRQWKVASAVLQILFKLLEGYSPKPDDFVDKFVEIQGGEQMKVPKPPGLILMTYMLNDTPMLKMVSFFMFCNFIEIKFYPALFILILIFIIITMYIPTITISVLHVLLKFMNHAFM